MKIESVDYQGIDFGDGMPLDIRMSRLNRVVIIAGPNGVGKTRLINRILAANRTATWKGGPHEFPPEAKRMIESQDDSKGCDLTVM